jgi:hypothetical protein
MHASDGFVFCYESEYDTTSPDPVILYVHIHATTPVLVKGKFDLLLILPPRHQTSSQSPVMMQALLMGSTLQRAFLLENFTFEQLSERHWQSIL